MNKKEFRKISNPKSKNLVTKAFVSRETGKLAGMTKRGFDAVDKRFDKVIEQMATKQDLEDLRNDLEGIMSEKFDKLLSATDKILAKLSKMSDEQIIISDRQDRIVNVLDVFFEVMKRRGFLVPTDIQKITKQDILTIIHHARY